ncbi:DnaJ protein homolog ANJ1 [Durusdinium trenchii]|uniref:DnaJ protein homolog ANJ1 n=1 Tax=Durusdinium trenchii TaxID=1381693 RepID=A0ABP0KFH4_9DINO
MRPLTFASDRSPTAARHASKAWPWLSRRFGAVRPAICVLRIERGGDPSSLPTTIEPDPRHRPAEQHQPASLVQAYHKQAREKHPDKGGDPDEFKEVNRAFEVLSDDEKRRRYVRVARDRWIEALRRGGQWRWDHTGEEGLEHVAWVAFGLTAWSGDEHASELLFGLLVNQRLIGSKHDRCGAPTLLSDLLSAQEDAGQVTLEELYTGITRQLPILRKVVDESGQSCRCDVCDGKGVALQVVRMGPFAQKVEHRPIPVQQTCEKCQGTGQALKMRSQREVLEVFVEKGSPNGHKIILHGKADEAPGCEPGDLVVVVREQAVDLPDKWRGVKKMAKW